ncbi:hypothetical protein [Oceanicella sp. SM1341]|uniref:hypothetical protein n=1 Tax=Oceanicella sp. SM1341 TaxID=1548889 RepID=UPI0018E4E801|nr:hypothetical protein [Oceanicella sp. SM1341]
MASPASATGWTILPFRLVRSLPAPEPGFRCVVRGVTCEGDLLLLWRDARDAPVLYPLAPSPAGAAPPRPKMDMGHAVRLLRVGEERGLQQIDLPPLEVAIDHVAMFPDGRVLLAGARSKYRGPDDHDLNVMIFDPATGRLERFLLGDGLDHVGIDGQGRIWGGYCDEGVFGHHGWGRACKGPEGPGAGGLVCFDDRGNQLWRFNGSLARNCIDDCYALNVSADRVWAYYYSFYYVCEVDADLGLRIDKPDVGSTHALAVSPEAFLFPFSFRDPDRSGFHLVSRADPDHGTLLTGVLPEGASLEEALLIGQGARMHAVTGTAWFCAEVPALA